MTSIKDQPLAPASTGIEGLDNVLVGGFTPERLYLIEGSPRQNPPVVSPWMRSIILSPMRYPRTNCSA